MVARPVKGRARLDQSRSLSGTGSIGLVTFGFIFTNACSRPRVFGFGLTKRVESFNCAFLWQLLSHYLLSITISPSNIPF